jgi:hypothetical protein
MVLYPLDSPDPTSEQVIPAWPAILHRQKLEASSWYLITQADHAVLSGELAARAAVPNFPRLPDEVIQAIALHDDGWREVDDPATPRVNSQGRPLSFLEVPPQDTLRAWRGSIARAAQEGPLAGVLISEHFCRIARDFAHAETTPPPLAQALTTFVEREISQQEEWRESLAISDADVSRLTDALQFFDLLSLYLCCGARAPVEFPQEIGGKRFLVTWEAGSYHMRPVLFPMGTTFKLSARRYPLPEQPDNSLLTFKIA